MNEQMVKNIIENNPPACEYGYPDSQLTKLFEDIVNESVTRAAFMEFMRGQTFTICNHSHDDIPKQGIFYVTDVQRFLRLCK